MTNDNVTTISEEKRALKRVTDTWTAFVTEVKDAEKAGLGIAWFSANQLLTAGVNWTLTLLNREPEK